MPKILWDKDSVKITIKQVFNCKKIAKFTILTLFCQIKIGIQVFFYSFILNIRYLTLA